MSGGKPEQHHREIQMLDHSISCAQKLEGRSTQDDWGERGGGCGQERRSNPGKCKFVSDDPGSEGILGSRRGKKRRNLVAMACAYAPWRVLFG